MSDDDVDGEKFDYEGTLIFNGLYRTEDPAEGAPEKSSIDELTLFQKGEPGEEHSGFRQIDLAKYTNRYENLGDALLNVAQTVPSAEFRDESFDRPSELVNNEGKPITGWERSTQSSYLYWDDPGHAFLQGSHGKVTDLKSALMEDWSGEIKLKPLKFDPDFLLYLVWQFDQENSVNGIKISDLKNAKLSGTISAHGEENEVRESTNITEALPVIEGILLNYNFQEIEGRFSLTDEHDIIANVRTQMRDYPTGRVHVKVEDAVESSPKLLRVLLALYFIRRLISLYDEWLEMDDEDRYVHPKYFAKLHRRATDLPQSAELDFPLKELVDDYAEKRGEDPDEYDLTWGAHDS